MTVVGVHKDVETLTMTITAEFDAAIERVWEMWDNPRNLERWWGPPTYPATVVDHDLTPGGTVAYFMTGPEGDQPRGWWRVIAVDPPRRLEFEDGFADEEGNPNPAMPTTTAIVTLSETSDGRTRLAIESTFPSREAMDQMVAMGVEEGITEAVGQIDRLLAESARA
jgi:uncharacterized protein YndB with AHSA1/START domain